MWSRSSDQIWFSNYLLYAAPPLFFVPIISFIIVKDTSQASCYLATHMGDQCREGKSIIYSG